jgi:PAS domain-containing protein
VGGIFVEGSDVTERTSAEMARQALAAQFADERTRLNTLIEHLPVGVKFVDRNAGTLLSNPAARRFLPDAVIPSRNAAVEAQWIGHDETGRRLGRDDFPGARALRGETVRGVEFLHRPPDGRKETWTRISGVQVASAPILPI